MKYSILSAIQLLSLLSIAESKLADRSRIVKARHESGRIDRYHDNGRPIEGQSYRSIKIQEDSTRIMQYNNKEGPTSRFAAQEKKEQHRRAMAAAETAKERTTQTKLAPWQRNIPRSAAKSKEEKEENIRIIMKGDVPLFNREDRIESPTVT